MKTKKKNVTIKQLVNGYKQDPETNSVIGFSGLLNIRPNFQREFVYNDKNRNAVINSVRAQLPLGIMYWSANHAGLLSGKKTTYELIDGQQRIISICEYVNGEFSVAYKFFHNLSEDEQNAILNYPLIVYVCEGDEKDRLAWFKTINIAGSPLNDQELRNATYTGPWLEDAKRYFSRPGKSTPAAKIASQYLRGSAKRQDYLKTAISWINAGAVEDYMSTHQTYQDASELWLYFQNVINWVNMIFPNYRKEMKGVNFGDLYNKHGKDQLNPTDLEDQIKILMQDEEVTNKSGIYSYVLTKEERFLNIRAFPPKIKTEVYERQNGKCAHCGEKFEPKQMHADHMVPWSEGGKTEISNCQMLCKGCNQRKGKK